jgi:N-acetylated-alpha-linked acidic dipeptidase
VDPSGGTAAMLELARALGALAKSERPPARSILFASWDAEEFALTSSTEWGEEHEARLTQNAVAYINVDGAASGSTFNATAVPALNRVIAEAAQAVRDPVAGIPIAAAVRDRRARDLGAVASGEAHELVGNRLGGGSDYTVFLNHLGIPVADITFAGTYGVYHSLYDTHRWVSEFGDPGFRYHVALVQLWGVLSLRLANADAIPLDYEEYADRIAGFVKDVERQPMQGAASARAFEELRAAAEQFRRAAAAFGLERDGALGVGDAATLRPLNRKVLSVERALLDSGGIRGRPWYRHLFYAPRPTYAPEVLPGVTEAVEAGDTERVAAEARRLASALQRAAIALQ